MEEYITNSEFEILLEDIQDKLDHQKIEECRAMLTQIIDDGKKPPVAFMKSPKAFFVKLSTSLYVVYANISK